MIKHVCTLFEGAYHVGVGSLFNSIYNNGFRGVFWVGYRGELPPWASNGQQQEGYFEFPAAEGAVIRFIRLETTMHLANYKPTFLLFLLNNQCGSNDSVYYFDPDITVKTDWKFFESWASYGMALVEDCTFPYLPADHPIRYRWLEVAHFMGRSKRRDLSRYYNSGFVGVTSRDKEALSLWEKVLQASQNFGYQLSGFKDTGATLLWRAADQDHLNLMLMLTDGPLSTIGPDGMDFRPGGYVMSHAVDSPKPWNRNYVRYALKGISPFAADKGFWENVSTPLSVYPAATVRRKKLSLRLSLAIGRLIHHAP